MRGKVPLAQTQVSDGAPQPNLRRGASGSVGETPPGPSDSGLSRKKAKPPATASARPPPPSRLVRSAANLPDAEATVTKPRPNRNASIVTHGHCRWRRDGDIEWDPGVIGNDG